MIRITCHEYWIGFSVAVFADNICSEPCSMDARPCPSSFNWNYSAHTTGTASGSDFLNPPGKQAVFSADRHINWIWSKEQESLSPGVIDQLGHHALDIDTAQYPELLGENREQLLQDERLHPSPYSFSTLHQSAKQSRRALTNLATFILKSTKKKKKK